MYVTNKNIFSYIVMRGVDFKTKVFSGFWMLNSLMKKNVEHFYFLCIFAGVSVQ